MQGIYNHREFRSMPGARRDFLSQAGGSLMPRMTTRMLDSGDAFPALEAAKVGGGKISLPGDLKGGWGVVLLYRGHW